MKKTILIAALTLLVANSAHAEEEYCREYNQTFTIGKKTQKGYGTACLQPDGSWKIVSQDDPVNTNINPDNQPENVKYIVREEQVYVVPPQPFIAPLVYPRGYNRFDRFNRYDRYDRYNRYNRYDRHNRYNRYNNYNSGIIYRNH